MQASKLNFKISRALINAPEECLQQKIQDKYGYSNQRKTYSEDSISQATEAALLKYYPKYCYAIHLDDKPKKHPVLHRIKQIKTISHFEYEFPYSRTKKFVTKTMEKLFLNKRKSLKSLPVIGYDDEPACRVRRITAMEMCSFFPQIETLKVRLSICGFSRHAKPEYIPGPLEDQILDRYGNFWDVLKHVKHLHIDFNPNLWVILPYLEKSQRFLSSLQSFRLTIMHCRMDSTDTPRKKFLSFLRNPGVLKYVTHINCQRFKEHAQRGWFHYYGHQIKSILDCCDKLKSIIFPIEEELYNSQSQFAGPKHYLTLAPLKSFNRLDSLDLMVYDTWSLLKGFELPPQLARLALRLYNLNRIWTAFVDKTTDYKGEDEKSSGSNDENRQVLTRFFEKISKLTHLSFLELNTRISNDILNGFIVPILQALPGLQKFDCNIYPQRYLKDPAPPLNLSFLLNSFTSLSQLQSFKISQSIKDEMELTGSWNTIITFNPQLQETPSFPNLTFINIDSVISEDFDFRAFFKAFSEGSHFKEINLAKIHVSSIQSLLKLFKIFKEAEQFSGLRISLDLIIFLQNLEDIDEYLQETITPAKNVSINFKVYISEQTCSPSAERIISLQKVFAKMKLTLIMPMKVMEKTRWSEYERIVPVSIIRNNHYSAPEPLKVVQDELSNDESSVDDLNHNNYDPMNTPSIGEHNFADTDEFDDESPPRPHPLDDEL